MDWLDRIISLYLFVGEEYAKNLWTYCQRFSNHSDLSFSYEEVMTIYLFGTMEGLTNKKQIYQHTLNYWGDLFPNVPSYVAFVQRVNKLGDVFIEMVEQLQAMLPKELFFEHHNRLVDSTPTIMARGGRRFGAKVAPEIADKNGYCATKKLHYYGVKLHVVGSSQAGTTPAGMIDIKAYEVVLPEILEYEKFADKAYIGVDGTKTYTPVKKSQGQEFWMQLINFIQLQSLKFGSR